MEFDPNLLSAIKYGSHNEEVQLFIRINNLYKCIDRYGYMLIHYAASYGNQIISKHLLDGGSDVDAWDSAGWTPLMTALYGRHDQVVNILLEAEADVFLENIHSESALNMFFEMHSPFSPNFQSLRDNIRRRYSNSEEAALRLINRGYNLEQALGLKDTKIIEYMLENGYRDALLKPYYSKIIQGKVTLLHMAVFLNDVEVIKVLIKHGADVNFKIQGHSPIFYVYTEDCPEDTQAQIQIFKVLLDAGVLQSENEYLQVYPALIWGPSEVIRLLLNSHIDFEAADSSGSTALHYLAQNVNLGVAEELNMHPVKFNMEVLEEGMAPLHVAAYYANLQMMEYFVDQGADVNFVRHPWKYPAIYNVYANGKLSLDQTDRCVEFLLQRHADPQFYSHEIDRLNTLFDVRDEEDTTDKLKIVVAHLALLEKCGTVITKIIRSKINSRSVFRDYFEECRRLLDDKISDRLTVFQLMTFDEKKLAKYFNNRDIAKELTEGKCQRKLKDCHSYYSNISEKQLSRGLLYKKLKDKGTSVLSQLLEYRFDESNIVLEKIIDFLDERDLRQLYQM